MYGLMSQNFVGDREDALGLIKGRGVRGEANHPVVALFALLDGERELATTPRINRIPRAASAENDVAHAVHDLFLTCLVHFGVEDQHELVGGHSCSNPFGGSRVALTHGG